MAIKFNEYKKISTNIFRHKKEYNKFYFRIKKYNKIKYKTLIIKENLTTQEYKNIALSEYTKFYKSLNEKQETKKIDDYTQITTLDQLYNFYKNRKKQEKTRWEKQKNTYYKLHIKDYFIKLNIQLQDLKANDINYFLNHFLEKKELGNRSIKVCEEILKPVFKFAFLNEIIKENIHDKIQYKRIYKSKIVVKATEKYKKLYDGINHVFKHDLFFRTFFLFGLSGRRKGEIIGLKIDNIDLKNNLYIIENTKNGETQQYIIQEFLKKDLLKLYRINKNNKTNLLFENKNTNKKITQIHRQVQQLKDYIKIDFSFHKFRHILISYLAEKGVDRIYLSGIIGHKHAKSIDTYLSLNYKKASEKMDQVVQKDIIPIKNYIELQQLKQQLKNTTDEKEKERIKEIIIYNTRRKLDML